MYTFYQNLQHSNSPIKIKEIWHNIILIATIQLTKTDLYSLLSGGIFRNSLLNNYQKLNFQRTTLRSPQTLQTEDRLGGGVLPHMDYVGMSLYS